MITDSSSKKLDLQYGGTYMIENDLLKLSNRVQSSEDRQNSAGYL